MPTPTFRPSALILLAGALMSVATSGLLPFPQTAVAGVSLAPARVEAEAELDQDLSIALAPSAMELALFQLTVDERLRRGLPGVEFDHETLTIARARADAQRPGRALSHLDPDGGLAFVRLLAANALYCCFSGENLARTVASETVAAERVHQALMASPSHRANILEPRFVRLAVGGTGDPQGQVVFAEIFRADAP